MKRLLGGGRMEWAHPVAKLGLAGLTVAALAFLGTLLFAQPANAVTTSGTWLNRFYIVGNDKQNYFDSNTYDDDYTYVELAPTDGCADSISFVHIGGSSSGGVDPKRNINFFYDDRSAYSIDNLPNSLWRVEHRTSTKYTSGTGGEACGSAASKPSGWTVNTNFKVASNGKARKFVFWQSRDNKITSFKSNVVFTQSGTFAGMARYVRQDEAADANNSCRDMIFLHAANIKTNGEDIFGRGEIAGSSMLYAVQRDDQLKRTSESYDRVSAPNEIGSNDCKIQADAINGRVGGTYGIAGYSADDKDFDEYFAAGGLQSDGSPATSGKEEDDAFIIFIGDENSVPKDASNVPITNTSDPTGDGDKTDQQTCKGGALGWIICPIVSAIQSGIDLMRDTMQYLLTVNPLPVGSGDIYTAWNNMRNFANIAFVLAFFAIIFSQATSVGLSNYGIKRLLPRLVVIAIATNLSYFACSFMIDFFNILGVGITNLFAIANGGSAGTVTVTNASGVIFTSGLVAGITWAIHSAAIVQVFPLIAAAFIGFLITFIILIARQAVIILLVVISPLAFVAGLLPGTQSWFKRWFDTFATLLLMYPFVMALFAAARLASAILTSVAGS